MGIKIKFADIDRDTMNISIKSVEKLLSKKTKAIVCVHYGGLPCEMDQLLKIAKKNNLILIEDAAQSHGAHDINFKNVGDYSIAAAYSFYPGKNLGAWGDGGGVTTNNKKLAEKLSALRVYGSEKKYYHKYLKSVV